MTNDTAVFMNALYGAKPADSQIVISTKNGKGWGPSTFTTSVTEAAELVAGAIDVYTRITTIGERPKEGRGKAADSVAVPGLWLEVDVNGAPDGHGGVIAGAFDTAEAGLELAEKILPLTMAVRSGYGGHGYALFPEPWILETDKDRAEATALVRRYQTAVRELAKAELGISKLDSTHDLARVFRPPGSFNHKGERPEPVQLLFATDTRIPVVAIKSTIPEITANGKPAKKRRAPARRSRRRSTSRRSSPTTRSSRTSSPASGRSGTARPATATTTCCARRSGSASTKATSSSSYSSTPAPATRRAAGPTTSRGRSRRPGKPSRKPRPS
jgi:hypothetical protein